MRLGENGAAAGDDGDAGFLTGFLQQALATARRRRGQHVFAAGKRILIVEAAADADEFVHAIVIRSDVFIADGPGNLPSITCRTFKVNVGVTEGNAAPDVGFAAASPHADKLEGSFGCGDVGLFVRAEIEGRLGLATVGAGNGLPGFDMGPIFGAVEGFARIEQQHVDALAGEVPGGHATGGAAADNDDVIDRIGLGGLHLLLHLGNGVCGPVFRVGAAGEIGPEGVAVKTEFGDQSLFGAVIPVNREVLQNAEEGFVGRCFRFADVGEDGDLLGLGERKKIGGAGPLRGVCESGEAVNEDGLEGRLCGDVLIDAVRDIGVDSAWGVSAGDDEVGQFGDDGEFMLAEEGVVLLGQQRCEGGG